MSIWRSKSSATKRRLHVACLPGRAIEQSTNFLIGRLRKILIPLADSIKIEGSVEANSMIGFLAELLTGGARTHGNGHDDLLWTLFPEGCDGGAHAGTCSQSIVYEDDRLSTQIQCCSVSSIQPFPPFQLLCLTKRYLLDLLR